MEKNDGLNIEAIRTAIVQFLDSLTLEKIIETYVDWSQYPEWPTLGEWMKLQEPDRNWLEKTAIAVFLEGWLESDPEWHCTVNRFSDMPYCRRSEKKRKNTDADDRDKKRFKRAAKVFYEIVSQRQQQIEEEKTGDGILEERIYGVVDLCWIDMYQEGKLGLLKELFYPSQRQTISEQDKIDRIKEAYEQLYVVLSNINNFYDEVNKRNDESTVCLEKKDIVSYPKIVAYNMAVRKIEQSNRLILSLMMAAKKCLTGHEVNFFDYESIIFWFRYPMERRKYSPSGEYKDWVVVDSPQDVMNYYYFLYCVCDKQAKNPYLLEKHRILREIFCDLLNYLNNTKFPRCSLPSWTDKHFEEAAEFYHTEYNFVNEYLIEREVRKKLTIDPIIENQIFRTCYQLLLSLQNYENSPLSKIRNENTAAMLRKQYGE